MTNEPLKVIHDTYKYKKQSLVAIFVIRLVLLCVLSASTVHFFADLYSFETDRFLISVIAVGITAFTYIVASLLPSVPVYGGIILSLAAVMWIAREKAAEYAAYFWDFMMLRLDSRFMKTTDLLINDGFRLTYGYLDDEMAQSCFIASAIFAVICAVIYTAASRTKFNFVVPLVVIGLILTPATIAEISSFSTAVIFFTSAIFALSAIRSSYDLDGLFVYGKLSKALKPTLKNESVYKKKTRFYIFTKKLVSDIPRYGKYSINAVSLFLAVLLVFTFSASVIPEGTGINVQKVIKYVNETSVKFGDMIAELFGETFGEIEDNGYFSFSSGGDMTGDISLAPPSNSNIPVLEVTLERNDIPVYLRGDIGVNYTGEGWTSIISESENIGERYTRFFDKKYYNFDYYMFRGALMNYDESLSTPVNAADEIIPLQNISIKYLRRTNAVFMPEGVLLPENELITYYGDFIARTNSPDGFSSVKESSFKAYTPYINNWLGHTFSSPENYVLDFDSSIDRQEILYYDYYYDRYVDDTYLLSDDVVSEYVIDLQSRNGIIGANVNRYDVTQAVCENLRTQFGYSLTINNGEDALSGFLYETKYGHCALFASAAVLTLRELGIPARYVTGYVVSGDGEAVDGGYKYVLTEKNLHAWIEVYFEDKGWMPFDPTAAAGSVPGGMTTTTPDITTTPDESEDDTDENGDTTTKPDVTAPDNENTGVGNGTGTGTGGNGDSESDGTGNDGGIGGIGGGSGSGIGGIGGTGGKPFDFGAFIAAAYPILIVIGVVIILGLAVTMFIRSVHRAERNVLKRFVKLNPTDATALMYRFLIAIYEKLGVVPETEFMADFAERVDKLPIMKNADVFLVDIMPVFEKCEFGSAEVSPVTEEERNAVYHVATTVYKNFMNNYNAVGRFFIKISLFL